jgi:hypothetical protein
MGGFEVEQCLEDGVAVISVSGDLDLAGAAELMANAEGVAQGGCGPSSAICAAWKIRPALTC